jgi:hypothetical protein
MAKSHAQRQKEYRDRKKAEEGSKWLEKESRRTKKYYTKIGHLTKSEANRRRQTLRIKQIDYRARKRARVNTEVENEPENLPSTSEASGIQYSEISSSDTRLIVKFEKKKRNTSSEKKLRKKIEYLKQVRSKIQKRNQNLRKKISRMNMNTSSPRTPKSRSERELRKAGIETNMNPKIKKKLLFANCISHELKRGSHANDRSVRRLIKRLIAGKILRKYKLVDFAENLTGVKVRNMKLGQKQTGQGEPKESIRKVREFLMREDNSRQMPGKADAVKIGLKERVQKFVLSDYLKNLYLKFKAENIDMKISFATFCRARPKHVTLVNYAARITCLCTRHQNFALKLQSLKRYGVTTNTSPDSFSQTVDTSELKERMKSTIKDQTVTFKEWKRVKCDDGKQRTKLIETQKEINKFVVEVTEEFEEFKDHAERVKSQYQSFKQMKDSLKYNKDHVCVQMDFAENFSLKEMEEIQSAYWNPESVTLHPVVVYYHGNEAVSHSSMVVVSEVLNHNSSMVRAILDKVNSFVKEKCPDAKYIHYWTDSPTSQYRNRTIFDLVARHESVFGLKASWQFFEAGHGKGACDGIGGSVKRSADTAIKTGKENITCGKDFFDWGSRTDSKIRYEFVDKTEYEAANKQVEERQKNIKPVKGTLKVHSVSSISEQEIMVRETTCVCKECFTEKGFVWTDENACGWRKYSLTNVKATEKPSASCSLANKINTDVAKKENTESICETPEYETGDFVAAVYEDEVYIGKIIDIDEESVQVKFMENGSKIKECLRWPTKEDIIWIEPDTILCKVHEPVHSGKGKRFFKISDEDKKKIDEASSKQ